MNLTQELKENYVKIIDRIWQGVMPYNSINNINEDVIEAMEDVLTQIALCSRNLLVLETSFKILYRFLKVRYQRPEKDYWCDTLKMTNPAKEEELLANLIIEWIKFLLGKKEYKTCVFTVARNYRSHIQMKLMGI